MSSSPSAVEIGASGTSEQNVLPRINDSLGSALTEATSMRLLDFNLIVIGQTDQAKELVENRFENKRGRVLWLEEKTLPADYDERTMNLNIRPDKRISLKDSVWMPPITGPNAIIHRGPIACGLDTKQEYHFQIDASGDIVGINVKEIGKDDADVDFALSGAVIFCAEDGSMKGFDPGPKLEELEVKDPNARSFSLYKVKGILGPACLFLALTVLEHLAIASELGSYPSESVTIWRATCTPWAFIFMLSLFQFLSKAGRGMELPMKMAIGLASITTCIFIVLRAVPVSMNITHASKFNLAPFASWSLCVSVLATLALVAPFSAHGGFRASNAMRARLWIMITISMGLLPWMALYAVSLGFLLLSASRPLLADLLLPLATSGLEVGGVKFYEACYRMLVWKPRVDASAKQLTGEQQLVCQFFVTCLHAMAEGTRLAALLGVTAMSKDTGWYRSVIFGWMINVLTRIGVVKDLISYTISATCSRCTPRHQMTCAQVLHTETKKIWGYPRILILLPVAVGRIAAGKHPLFDNNCVLLAGSCLVLELLEDAIVLHLPVRLHRWRERARGNKTDRHALDPTESLGHMKQGDHTVYTNRPGMLLTCVMDPPWYFYPFHVFNALSFMDYMLQLLCGAGFVFGVCDTAMELDKRLLDAVFQEYPLRCA